MQDAGLRDVTGVVLDLAWRRSAWQVSFRGEGSTLAQHCDKRAHKMSDAVIVAAVRSAAGKRAGAMGRCSVPGQPLDAAVVAAAVLAAASTVFPGFLVGALSVQVSAEMGVSEAVYGWGLGSFFLAATIGLGTAGPTGATLGAAQPDHPGALGSRVCAAGDRDHGPII